jgi:hypothetical protein
MQGDGPLGDVSDETLSEVFQGTLTLLYRLLFLLYAEARGLLPSKEVRGYFEASLTKMKQETAEQAEDIADEAKALLEGVYGEDGYALYDRLARLFRALDEGDASVNVPFYDGGLFLTRPEAADSSPEAAVSRFLSDHKIPDRYLARALDLLARAVDDKRQSLVFTDYKSLGVRQLGSIYEGLLEFKLRVADRKLAIVKEKAREVYVPFFQTGREAEDPRRAPETRREEGRPVPGKRQAGTQGDRLLLHPRSHRRLHRPTRGGTGFGPEVRGHASKAAGGASGPAGVPRAGRSVQKERHHAATAPQRGRERGSRAHGRPVRPQGARSRHGLRGIFWSRQWTTSPTACSPSSTPSLSTQWKRISHACGRPSSRRPRTRASPSTPPGSPMSTCSSVTC